MKTLFTSTIFHITLFIVIVMSVITWVQKDRQKEVRSRVAFLKGDTSFPRQNKKASRTTSQVRVADSKVANASAFSVEPESTVTSPEKLQLALTTDQKIDAQRSIPSRMSTYFLEVDIAELQKLFQQAGLSLPSADSFAASKIPQLLSWVQKNSGGLKIKVLQKTTKLIDGNTHQWFSGVETDNNDFDTGITTLVTYQSYNSFPVEGEIELLTSVFGNPQDEYPTRESFQDRFSLRKNEGFIITGLLLPKKVSDNEKSLYSQSPLRILLSSRFQSGKSTFVVATVIHAQ